MIVEPVKGLNYFMEERLVRSLDEKVKGKLGSKDEDYVIVIDGKERTGKSCLAMQIGKYVDPSLDLSRVCFTPDEFRQAILNAKKGQCVIFDEAYRGFGSASALSEVNKILRGMMMEMGQKNLFVIIVLPTFYLLEKYVALWRTRGLFHIIKKSYWVFFNSKKKQRLYLNPIGKRYYTYKHIRSRFKGRFYGKYVVDEVAYRKKKSLAFKMEFKSSKGDKFKLQRNKLIYYIYKEQGVSIRELSELLKSCGVQLNRAVLGDIVAKLKGRAL